MLVKSMNSSLEDAARQALLMVGSKEYLIVRKGTCPLLDNFLSSPTATLSVFVFDNICTEICEKYNLVVVISYDILYRNWTVVFAEAK